MFMLKVMPIQWSEFRLQSLSSNITEDEEATRMAGKSQIIILSESLYSQKRSRAYEYLQESMCTSQLGIVPSPNPWSMWIDEGMGEFFCLSQWLGDMTGI